MKYIGFSIGPIHKTFKNVRKTRELWAASYIFSWFVQNIIIAFKDRKFVQPYIHDERLFNNLEKKGVGMFPDRFIFESKDGDFDKIQEVVNTTIKNLAYLVLNKPEEENIDDNEQFKFLKSYLRVFIIEKAINENPNDQGNENPVLILTKYLDSLELQDNITVNQHLNPLPAFFNSINKTKFFKENAFIRDSFNQVRFESLSEISSRELNKIPGYKKLLDENIFKDLKDTDNEEGFLDKLKSLAEKNFKPYHKYIAIIKADGDKIGSILKEINSTQNEKFSKQLSNWRFETKKIIEDYQGVPVYIGGDDLLLFVPVCNSNSPNAKNIVELITLIDEAFKDQFKDPEFGIKPTLSYGVSITYYKYPLYEALEAADELLHRAKEHSVDKNTIAIRLLKHSGSVIECILQKDTAIYKKLNSKLTEENLMKRLTADNSFLNSAMYKIQLNKEVFDHLENDKDRIGNFIDNSFDEAIHLGPKSDFLTSLKTVLPELFEIERDRQQKINAKGFGTSDIDIDTLIETNIVDLYSLLKIIKFLNGLEDNHE